MLGGERRLIERAFPVPARRLAGPTPERMAEVGGVGVSELAPDLTDPDRRVPYELERPIPAHLIHEDLPAEAMGVQPPPQRTGSRPRDFGRPVHSPEADRKCSPQAMTQGADRVVGIGAAGGFWRRRARPSVPKASREEQAGQPDGRYARPSSDAHVGEEPGARQNGSCARHDDMAPRV